jgi:hypothetical protein
MNTEELLNMEPLAVPWYDTVEETDVEPSDDIDEFALEIEREIAKGEKTLEQSEFKEGKIIRNNPEIQDVLAKPQQQAAMPWE